MPDAPLSKTSVQRAGDVLRASRPEIVEEGSRVVGIAFDTASSFSPEEILQAVQIVQRYRDGHFDAQQNVHLALATAHGHAGFSVSSRQKRMQAISDKLQRFNSLRLPQMADIAGCRVVVNELSEIEVVEASIGSNFEIVDIDDYIDPPKAIGYRAKHVTVSVPNSNHAMTESSQSTLVEIQLRTPRQNEWADQIERATGTTGLDLKGGIVAELPEELVEYVRVASDIRFLLDSDHPADARLELRLSELREAVRRYF